MVGIGDRAPEFDAPTTQGASLRLSAHRGHPVVLYFYPEADTPGCTVESKSFRDSYTDFRARGVEIIGVSVDGLEKQQAFCTKYSLPFPLVADSSKTVAQSYGVLGLGGKARRVTFFIDPKGTVLDIVDTGKPAPHVDRARELFLK